MRAALALGALLAACTQPAADGAPTFPEDAAAPGSGAFLLVPEDEELAELLERADASWERVGVAPDRIRIGAPGDAGGMLVSWWSSAAITEKCAPDGHAIGCLDRWADGLLVAFDAPAETLPMVVRHEMGHALRLDSEAWHLDCADPSEGTMCSAPTPAVEVTEADVAFVCGSAAAPCER